MDYSGGYDSGDIDKWRSDQYKERNNINNYIIMEVVGKVVKVGEIQEVGSKGFKKRELVVETDEKYPQKLLIEFTQDKVALIGTYKPGDAVKVGINLRGREWTNPQGEVKYFNSIVGWKIDKVSGNEAPLQPQAQQDDLPF